MRRRTGSIVVVTALAGAVLWAALLPLAGWAVQSDVRFLWRGLGLFVYRFAAALCHQLPERSFAIGAVPMPVCARCAGLYFGAAAMAMLAAGSLRSAIDRSVGPRDGPLLWMSGAPAVRVLVLAALPTAASLAYEWVTGHDPGNWIRAVAGAPLGAAVAAVLVGEARSEDLTLRQLRH